MLQLESWFLLSVAFIFTGAGGKVQAFAVENIGRFYGGALRLWRRFRDYAVAEAARQDLRLIMVAPVLLAFGIGWYFSLRFEPSVFVSYPVLAGLAAAVFATRGGWRAAFLCACLVCLGFCAAQWRTAAAYTPMLEKPVKFADIEGRIAGIEPLDKGVRLLLTDVVIEGFTPAATPTMTRVKSRSGDGLAVGQRIRALASLNPPSPPVLPGGFDFQRHMYFQGIGALGFLYKKPEVITPASRASMHSMVERLRGFIGRRIVQGEAQPAAGLALALIIGQRKSIDESDLDAIRASGLAHMLAISGLHIGLFSGALFFAARLVMAAFPAFALRRPIKKYAAVIALLGAFFYMLIAGATIPSQRAMMTAAIIFGAVLCDRSPFSLRVVACAAFAILLMFPESLMSASFQMSFAAVTALVAFYDWIRPQWSRLHRKAGMLRRAGLYCIGVSMTSVIASAATAPFALYHFGQIAVYGLLANFICVPVLGFVIMPAAIVALALMPFGLEGIAFAVMAPALDFMLWTARFVAALDGAVWRLPQFSTLCLLFLILAALGMVLLRSHFRVMIVSWFIFLFVLNFKLKQYDVLISSDFDLIAFRESDADMRPMLFVSSRKKAKFERENWERSIGAVPNSAQSLPKEGAVDSGENRFVCGEAGCRITIRGVHIAYLRDGYAAEALEDCGWADVIISEDPVRGQACAARVIDRFDVYKHGAHGLVLGEGIGVERVEDSRGARPWVSRDR